ncbi:MAG: peptide deformylase [Magnetococcales bacterium]|nr:peptide deformylase [Magnetococcales bacterium]
MAILPLLTAPDKRLKKVARPVERVDDAIRRLMDDMLDTMYRAPGVGLAAPQVGVSRRVIVADVAYVGEEKRHEPIFLANPEILEREGELVWEEGCLSVPETQGEVTRSARVTVRGLNREGVETTLTGEGLLAVCLQHEIDHLNGVLFIDHLSRLKRDMILKRLKKLKEDEN